MKNNRFLCSCARKFTSIVFFFLVILAEVSVAVEPTEKSTGEDAGLAAVWIMTEITQGGYLKPAMNFTVFDSDASLMGEIEAGWRFTNWFKFGANLKRTFTEVNSLNDHVTSFGLIAGVSARNPILGNFTIDLSVGSLDIGSGENTQYYIEPGLHIKRRLYRKIHWTSGITYRFVEDESVAIFGSNSLNSLSLKLGLVGSKY